MKVRIFVKMTKFAAIKIKSEMLADGPVLRGGMVDIFYGVFRITVFAMSIAWPTH